MIVPRQVFFGHVLVIPFCGGADFFVKFNTPKFLHDAWKRIAFRFGNCVFCSLKLERTAILPSIH